MPEYCRNCEKGIKLWAIVGCKLYKISFSSPIFCQKLELVIRIFLFPLERSRTYSVGGRSNGIETRERSGKIGHCLNASPVAVKTATDRLLHGIGTDPNHFGELCHEHGGGSDGTGQLTNGIVTTTRSSAVAEIPQDTLGH